MRRETTEEKVKRKRRHNRRRGGISSGSKSIIRTEKKGSVPGIASRCRAQQSRRDDGSGVQGDEGEGGGSQE